VDAILGSVSFDAVGDTTLRSVAIYQIVGGDWAFDSQVTLTP